MGTTWRHASSHVPATTCASVGYRTETMRTIYADDRLVVHPIFITDSVYVHTHVGSTCTCVRTLSYPAGGQILSRPNSYLMCMVTVAVAGVEA